MWSLGAIALWRLSETIKVLAAGYTLVLLGLSLVAVSTARNLTPFSLTVMTLFFPIPCAFCRITSNVHSPSQCQPGSPPVLVVSDSGCDPVHLGPCL